MQFPLVSENWTGSCITGLKNRGEYHRTCSEGALDFQFTERKLAVERISVHEDNVFSCHSGKTSAERNRRIDEEIMGE